MLHSICKIYLKDIGTIYNLPCYRSCVFRYETDAVSIHWIISMTISISIFLFCFTQDYNSTIPESEPEGLDYFTNLFTVESQVLRQKSNCLSYFFPP